MSEVGTHRSIVEIVEVSGDGCLVKKNGKRKYGLAYYVMKLAECGEIYRIVDQTE
jgi:hypothetical protein